MLGASAGMPPRFGAERSLLATARPGSPEGFEGMAQDTERHMTDLLKPFAEHVRGLQASLAEILQRLDRVDARIDTQDKRLADNSSWGQKLKSGLDPLKAHLVALQNSLARQSQEQAALAQDHEETKASCKGLDERLTAATGFSHELQRDLDATNQRIEHLRADLQETQKAIAEGYEPTLQGATQRLTELEKLARATSEGLEEKGNFLVKTASSLNDLRKTCKGMQAEEEKHYAEVSLQVRELKGEQKKTASLAAKQGEELSATSAEAKELRGLHEKLAAEQTGLQASLDKLGKEFLNLKVRVVPMEKGLFSLLEAANHPVKNDPSKRRNVGQYLRDLEAMINENVKQIEELRTGQSSVMQSIRQQADGLVVRVDQLEGGLDRTNGEVRDLHGMHGTSRSLLDTSMGLHSDAKQEFTSNTERLNALRSDILTLQQQFAAANDSMSKMHASLELCYDYFGGMRKGFRDAGARVTGAEDSLLPEATTMRPRSTTPVLPNMRSGKSATPSTAWGSNRESPGTPAVLSSARGEQPSSTSPVVLGASRGILGNSANHADLHRPRTITR